ncbi:MAG: cobalt ECF transporter T component CbiQ [Bacillota bacterium]|nr:cobalt ECF transporter T component CbiQ [Bacillota bacterium]
MSNIIKSLYNIRMLDELAEKRTFIHNIHPLIKVLTTCVYLTVTVSFDKYELSGLLPLIFYPVVMITLAEIPMIPILKRMLVVIPLIIGIGIFNPLFDHKPMVVLPWIQISGGWISFFSIMFKGGFTILAALILIATTGMTRIASALRMIRVPRLFVLQLLLTYRYISVLMEEAGRTWNAYMLRAPGQKSVNPKAWGPLAGQMLMRTYDRAQRVYQAMGLRGFNGEYNPGDVKKVTVKDILYFTCWAAFFAVSRYFNLPALIGEVVTGVMK